MVEKLSKYIANKCSHCASRLILIGKLKMPIAKEILDMLEIGRKPSQVIYLSF